MLNTLEQPKPLSTLEDSRGLKRIVKNQLKDLNVNKKPPEGLKCIVKIQLEDLNV